MRVPSSPPGMMIRRCPHLPGRVAVTPPRLGAPGHHRDPREVHIAATPTSLGTAGCAPNTIRAAPEGAVSPRGGGSRGAAGGRARRGGGAGLSRVGLEPRRPFRR